MNKTLLIKFCGHLDEIGLYKESEKTETFIKTAGMPSGTDAVEVLKKLLSPPAQVILDRVVKQFSNKPTTKSPVVTKNKVAPTKIPLGDFDQFRKFLAPAEGGYSNRKVTHDRGGATNKGITWKVYNAYRKKKGLPIQSVKFITDQEAREITKNQYWDQIKGDYIPKPIAMVLADWKFNGGYPIHNLQKILGVPQSGVIGKKTVKALWGYVQHDNQKAKDIANKLLDLRKLEYEKNPTAIHNPGWFPRIENLRKLINSL